MAITLADYFVFSLPVCLHGYLQHEEKMAQFIFRTNYPFRRHLDNLTPGDGRGDSEKEGHPDGLIHLVDINLKKNFDI